MRDSILFGPYKYFEDAAINRSYTNTRYNEGSVKYRLLEGELRETNKSLEDERDISKTLQMVNDTLNHTIQVYDIRLKDCESSHPWNWTSFTIGGVTVLTLIGAGALLLP